MFSIVAFYPNNYSGKNFNVFSWLNPMTKDDAEALCKCWNSAERYPGRCVEYKAVPHTDYFA